MSDSEDDLYGSGEDDDEYVYEDEEGAVDAMSSSSPASAAHPAGGAGLERWQAEAGLGRSTSAVENRVFVDVPDDPRVYRARVVRREQEAAKRASAFRIRSALRRLCRPARIVASELAGPGTSAPGSGRLAHAREMLALHQEKALGMLEVTGQDTAYCMAALETSGWSPERAINWHLTEGNASAAAFQVKLRAYQDAIDAASSAESAPAGADEAYGSLSEDGRDALRSLDFAPIDARTATPVEPERVKGGGPTIAARWPRPVAPRVEVHIAEAGMPASSLVRLGFVPKRLRGGTLVRMSASSVAARECGSGAEASAAAFHTVGPCNVYVCVHLSLLLQGFEPSWLVEQGFRLCPDCVVSAEREDHGFFAVYRGAAVSARRWVLGNNATDVPVGVAVPGSMFFAVLTRLDGDDAFGVALATDPAAVDAGRGAAAAASSSSSSSAVPDGGSLARSASAALGAVASAMASLW